MSKLFYESYSIENILDDIENIWDDFFNDIKEEEHVYIKNIENDGFDVYGRLLDIEFNKTHDTIQCYIVLFDKSNQYNANDNKPYYLANITDSVGGYSFYKDGWNCVQINIPCLLKKNKRRNFANSTYIDINNEDKERGLRTFKHEVTHAFDKQIERQTKRDDITYQKTITDFNIEDLSFEQKYLLMDALHLIYEIWDKSEFNAQQHSVIDTTSDKQINNIRLKYYTPYEELDILKRLKASNDKVVWSILKIYIYDGLSNKLQKEKITKMSLENFKKYFITRTDELISKFKLKTTKNLYNRLENQKEKEQIAEDVYNCLVGVIKGDKTNIKTKPLSIVIKTKLYSIINNGYIKLNIIFKTPLNTISSLKNINNVINEVKVYAESSSLNKELDVDESLLESILLDVAYKRIKNLKSLSTKFSKSIYYQLKK